MFKEKWQRDILLKSLPKGWYHMYKNEDTGLIFYHFNKLTYIRKVAYMSMLEYITSAFIKSIKELDSNNVFDIKEVSKYFYINKAISDSSIKKKSYNPYIPELIRDPVEKSILLSALNFGLVCINSHLLDLQSDRAQDVISSLGLPSS